MNRGELTAGAGLALVRGQTDVKQISYFFTVNDFLNIQRRDFSKPQNRICIITMLRTREHRVIDKQLLLTSVMAILI